MLLWGVMAATNLIADNTPLGNHKEVSNIADFSQEEYYEEFLLDVNHSIHPHFNGRRRCSSSQNQSIRKTKYKRSHTKVYYSVIAENQATELAVHLSHIKDCNWQLIVPQCGSELVTRLHQFRI